MQAHLLRRSLLGVVVIATVLAVDPVPRASAAGPTCLGLPATITAVVGVPTVGTSGDDVIVGTPGPDAISGRGGNDVICGGAGNDRIRGGPGSDRISLGPGADKAWGNAGADVISGGRGWDFIDGGSGPDTCRGGTGTARLRNCETVGGTRLLRKSDFAGTWDVRYSNPRLFAVPGPCDDTTPELQSQGWYMHVVACGTAIYVGNFTPAQFCMDQYCGYIFSPTAIALDASRPGTFRFTYIGGTPIPATGWCTQATRLPGNHRVEVTHLDGGNRVVEFRWRAPAGDCRTVYGVTTGWASTALATVFRVS